jgi:hypothetical protein
MSSRLHLRPPSPAPRLATGLVSCNFATSPTSPSPVATLEVVNGSGGLVRRDGLVLCRPEPYAITQQMVGPAGGTLRVGERSVAIPQGALSLPVLIIAEAPSDTFSSVQFQAEALSFKRMVILTLDYSSCPVACEQSGKDIAHTTSSGKILRLHLSKGKRLMLPARAEPQHFSRYAVVW